MRTNINLYNSKNLLVKTPQGEMTKGIYVWQGIRSLGNEVYLICGTTNPNPNTGYGIIYIGNINCKDGKSYLLNVPKSIGIATSIYGPNYDNKSNIYTFVGSFLDYKQNIKGFIYQGEIQGLNNPNNIKYPLINKYYKTNFFHSYSNNLFVGNGANNLNDTISYIYDVNDLNKIKTTIKYPKSITTTSYGIWYNGNNIYTIVGGYTDTKINKELIDIIKDGVIYPIGKAFIVDYNANKNIFFNWTSITLNNLVTHFQGIFKNDDNTYSINADILDLSKSKLPQGYFGKISRNKDGTFSYNTNNFVLLNQNQDYIISSNSVANNKVIGLLSNVNESIACQLNINYESNISLVNKKQSIIKDNELLLFDKVIINQEFIEYNNGVFTFLEKGLYIINFNIYIENTRLESIKFDIELKKKKKKESILISEKGIDKIGTTTAHSMVVPCSFSDNFNINDTLKIKNVSCGDISLISNYVPDATNALISINKIN